MEKENQSLRSQVSKKTEREDELTRELEQLQRSKTQFIEQIGQIKDENRSSYEAKFAEELKRIQDASSKELKEIRERNQDVWERENRVLREARDEALRQVDRLRAKLDDSQTVHDEYVLNQARMESKYELTVSELRNEIKMKVFENNQIGLSYETKMDELRRLNLQVEMLQQKLEVQSHRYCSDTNLTW